MNVEQAVKLAESKKGLQAIMLEGMCVVASATDVEKAEARGVEFSYLYRHEGDGPCKGKVVGIPNFDERE